VKGRQQINNEKSLEKSTLIIGNSRRSSRRTEAISTAKSVTPFPINAPSREPLSAIV
jgi:hypothetical protein